MSKFKRTAKTAKTPAENQNIPSALLRQARKSGQLNLSNRDLQEVPATVWMLNKPPGDEDDVSFASDQKWWEQVELSKLILASNSLRSLSENLSEFSSLAVLDVHDNKLQELPKAIGSLEKLQKLDVSHNELQILPEEICSLKSLTVLFLQHNQIPKLPSRLAILAHLQVLDLSNNQFQDLPVNFGELGQLQRLNLSHNSLKSLPDDLCRLTKLTYLDLEYNKLAGLPTDCKNLEKLKELHARNNLLEEIPDLSKCYHLKEVYFASNRLKSMQVFNLPESLVILELRGNKIEMVEDGIVGLKDLQRLDLANNDISMLPPKMGCMEKIQVINIDGNPMRGLRRDIINKGTRAIMKYLQSRVVETEENGTTADSSLPASTKMVEVSKMHVMAATKSLDVSGSAWSSKSEKIIEDCFEIPLETINLSRMGLTELPPSVFHFCSTLRSLNLSLNKLSHLGAQIGSFSSITHLNLSSNCLCGLPLELGNLTQIMELNICDNKFTCLPECLYQLQSLEHLLAGGNQIGKINVNGLKNLPNISTLGLQNNNISQVPPELGLVSSLRNLQLEGNTFRIPRHNVLQQGTQAVLEYLRGRIPIS